MAHMQATYELLVVEQPPDFNSLHGLALKRIGWDRRCGVPPEGVAYMMYQWLADLVAYDVANANVVHEVQLALEADKEIKREDGGLAVKKLQDALDTPPS